MPDDNSPLPATPKPRRRRQPWSLARVDTAASPYLYIAPFFVLFALVGLFPLVYTLVVSLHDWELLKGQGEFVGLDNFAAVLGDRFFWNSIGNTISIFLLSTIPQWLIALVLAAILDQHLKARTFWRMSVLLPYVVTPVAVALIFSSIFNEQSASSTTSSASSASTRVAVEERRARQPRRDRDDGQLALDRLQRPDPARRDAGRAARPSRIRGDRRCRRRRAGSSRSRSPASARP